MLSYLLIISLSNLSHRHGLWFWDLEHEGKDNVGCTEETHTKKKKRIIRIEAMEDFVTGREKKK